jgi:hypothetical protein
MSGTLLSIALAHARAGRAILPAHSVRDDGRCTCGRRRCQWIGKHPRTEHGVHDATRKAETLSAWWDCWPDANLALATGEDSCVDVLDVDPEHDGPATLARLEAEHGTLPATWRARTGSGGEHIYFWHEPGMGNSVSRIGRGLDVRGEGGYVLLPPSLHRTGRRYSWIIPPDEGPPAGWPDWLAKLAMPQRPRDDHAAGATSAAAGPLPVPPGLLRYAEDGAPEGERNARGFWLACRLVQECSATPEARAALDAFARACRPALEDEEVERIWRNAKAQQPFAPRLLQPAVLRGRSVPDVPVRGGIAIPDMEVAL